MLGLSCRCIGALRLWRATVGGLIIAVVCAGFSVTPDAAQPHKGSSAGNHKPGVQVPVQNSGAKKPAAKKKPGKKKPGKKKPGAKKPGAKKHKHKHKRPKHKRHRHHWQRLHWRLHHWRHHHRRHRHWHRLPVWIFAGRLAIPACSAPQSGLLPS